LLQIFKMKTILLSAIILLSACSKKTELTPVQSQHYHYKNLGNFELSYDRSLNLDLNNDGVIDFAFATLATPDYESIEKLEFRAYTLNGSLLYNNSTTPKVFNKGEKISSRSSENFNWTKTNAFLATRVYTADPSSPAWAGAWKDKTDRYLAVRCKGADKFYNGWIRISCGGIHSKLIIHDYAIQQIPEADIEAGDLE
jgi:hypothetical protein